MSKVYRRYVRPSSRRLGGVASTNQGLYQVHERIIPPLRAVFDETSASPVMVALDPSMLMAPAKQCKDHEEMSSRQGINDVRQPSQQFIPRERQTDHTKCANSFTICTVIGVNLVRCVYLLSIC